MGFIFYPVRREGSSVGLGFTLQLAPCLIREKWLNFFLQLAPRLTRERWLDFFLQLAHRARFEEA